MSAQPIISLVPLSLEWHTEALQQLYWATPGYWAMYNHPTPPTGQAEHDLRNAVETPGRTLLGIVCRVEETNGTANGELVGIIDFRLDWPDEGMAYLGLVMVAEPYQRQGIGRAAWKLLRPWLARQAQIQKVRVAVEQFNPSALQFFASLGFTVTGEARRLQIGGKFVRLLYMELASPSVRGTDP